MTTAVTTPPPPWTVEDFLAWERQQEERYEFVGGMIRMMVGGTADHNSIALNVASSLRNCLGGSPCRAFMEGMKVVSATTTMYPDVVVTCSQMPAKSDVVTESSVVFEVPSRSTEGFDRGQKWLAYQSIDSLEQYVLISQDELRVDVYTRREDGWDYRALRGPDATLGLAIRQIQLSMAEIYQSSSLDPAASG
jgi:Uma2 family endonuclease